MGTADRDYFRDEERRYHGGGGGGGAGGGATPVVKWLIAINAVLFFIDLFTRPGPLYPDAGVLNTPFAFTIRSAFLEGRVWELLTFQFLHASPWHLIANCIGLYFFGPWAERWWGSGRYLGFYLASGVAGALFFTLLALTGALPGRNLESALIGASAGVYGTLISVAVINPNARARLLIPPVELSLRTLALVLVGLAIVMILGDNFGGGSIFSNSGGEAGHLGGAIAGFLMTRLPWLLRRPGGGKIIRPKEFKRPAHKPKLAPRSAASALQESEVDRILDKINREGLGSLSEEEHEVLRQVSKQTPTSRDS